MRTVKVRIAVAVDPDGRWSAFAYSDKDGIVKTTHDDLFVDDMKDGEARYFVTADLPIPETVEIQGTVDEAQA